MKWKHCFRRLVVKPETLIEVPWEIDPTRDRFIEGQPVITQGYLRLQKPGRKITASLFFGDGKAFFFGFFDGKKEWGLLSNEVYWMVPEFAQWKPEKEKS